MKRYLLLILLLACYALTINAQPAPKPITGKHWSLPLPGDKQLTMSWIPPGKFIMGSPVTEAGHKNDESSQTTVNLTKGYWLASTLLTIGEWKAVTGQTLREKVTKMLNDETL